MKQLKIQTDYLEHIFTPTVFNTKTKKLISKIKEFKKKNKVEAIAFCGQSGAAMAYVVAYSLKIPLLCVRKPDKSHSPYKVEGNVGAKNYIIVDDFIDSGKTMDRIIKNINKCNMIPPKPIGIFLYNDYPPIDEYKNIPVILV